MLSLNQKPSLCIRTAAWRLSLEYTSKLDANMNENYTHFLLSAFIENLRKEKRVTIK